MTKRTRKTSRKKKTEAAPGPATATLDARRLPALTDELQTFVQSAEEAEQWDLSASARTLSNLVQIAECGIDDPDATHQASEMIEFVETHLEFLSGDGTSADPGTICEIRQQAYTRWGDVLELVADAEIGEIPWGETSPTDRGREVPAEADASQQIDLVLSLLGQSASGEQAEPAGEPETPGKTFESSWSDDQTPPQTPDSWSVPDHLQQNSELCEAFLDDANRCLTDMESVVLDGGSFADDGERSREFCRQLHTLKGAAASVGLETLAGYLHEVEEWLDHTSADADRPLDDSLLLAAVDSVRRQTALLGGPDGDSGPDGPRESAAAPVSSLPAPTGSGDQSVRVRAAQLDRLMGMLAELVVIRNRRETWVNDLLRCNDELGRCSNRIRRFSDNAEFRPGRERSPGRGEPATGGLALGHEPSGKNALDEVASDVMAIAREMADTYQPLSDENAILSRFIRQFRQELMQLRRLPVAGLFQRLKRAIHDVARVEEKQVEIRVVGDDTGLEQSVQERLFEPLLHMVRNSVSHGIETPEVRVGNKKPETGTVTLEARATASMLTILVSDDGRGLDYEGLRRRGFERGLLAPGSNPGPGQLARLIFHPGFSTRDQASQVSGRGVGMDVVATTIDRMQGRIDVDSTAGGGTRIQLSIPLTTGIEHVMVYRAGGVLFALPMRSIQAADLITAEDAVIVPFSRSIGLPRDRQAARHADHTLMLDEGLGMQVDEVIGPDEVVVRPLPGMVRRHPLVCGVVKSASGETVLLLNADRTREWCLAGQHAADPDDPAATADLPDGPASPAPVTNRPVALVVDDSLTARMLLARKLTDRGFQVEEANDGLAALACMQKRRFEFLFTDLDMPRMGGLELLGEVSQLECGGLNSVVVTSRNKDEVWQRASGNGAVGYLSKPVSGESIDRLLDQLKPTGD